MHVTSHTWFINPRDECCQLGGDSFQTLLLLENGNSGAFQIRPMKIKLLSQFVAADTSGSDVRGEVLLFFFFLHLPLFPHPLSPFPSHQTSAVTSADTYMQSPLCVCVLLALLPQLCACVCAGSCCICSCILLYLFLWLPQAFFSLCV